MNQGSGGGTSTQGYGQDTCHAYVEGVDTSYGYVPSLAAAATLVAFFGLSMFAHIGQMTLYRSWWTSLFAIGCGVEILGWAARIWSAKCPYAQNPYMIQETTLIIAPTFFTAGIYVLLGRLIRIFGSQSSFLSPKLYIWIFCTCDVIALAVQGAGGGMASSGGGGSDSNTQTTGTHVMVGGIIFQLVSITIFVGFAIDFVWRIVKGNQIQGHDRALFLLGAATCFSLLLIYIRSIYRTIELLNGWTSSTMKNEKLLIGLDGAMMTPAVLIYNIFHPGQLIPRVQARGDYTKSIPQSGSEFELVDTHAEGHYQR